MCHIKKFFKNSIKIVYIKKYRKYPIFLTAIYITSTLVIDEFKYRKQSYVNVALGLHEVRGPGQCPRPPRLPMPMCLRVLSDWPGDKSSSEHGIGMGHDRGSGYFLALVLVRVCDDTF